MSHKFGFPGMTKRAMGDKPSTPSKSFNSGGVQILCRVTDIILNAQHPLYNPNLGFSQIGSIIAEAVSPNSTVSQKVFTASPASSNIKQLPLVNEYVYVYKVVSPNRPSGKWVYDPHPVSLYDGLSPNTSPYPNPITNLSPESQKIDYTQVENGAFNIPNSTPTQLSLNSGVNPTQDTFVEKSNIHPLTQFAGDITYEGRWGNSIRFGSTNIPGNSTSQINNWSLIGNSGDPITIIRNGQPTNTNEFGGEPITENISEDLSSLYLTSYQKIPFGVSREEFQSNKWLNPPPLPSEYSNPQIITNSDRVVINAKNDSILISAQKSIGLSCYDEINLIGKNLVLDGQNVYLGSKNATQSVLKGDDTIALLKEVLMALKNLTAALEPTKTYLNGVPSPNVAVQMSSKTANQIISSAINQLDNLKSSIVKTQ